MIDKIIEQFLSRFISDPLAQLAILVLVALASIPVAILLRRQFGEPIAEALLRIFRGNGHRSWSMVAAKSNELEHFRHAMNKYMGDNEKLKNTDAMLRFHAVRPDDYLFLRGPVTRFERDANYGVAIVHPLKAVYGKQFEKGKLVGKNLEPNMLHTRGRAKYFYVSFAEADNHYSDALIDRLKAHILAQAELPFCVIARPTTDKAIYIVSRKQFAPCKSGQKELAVHTTCFKWVTTKD